jgi:hypothetical protein
MPMISPRWSTFTDRYSISIKKTISKAPGTGRFLVVEKLPGYEKCPLIKISILVKIHDLWVLKKKI